MRTRTTRHARHLERLESRLRNTGCWLVRGCWFIFPWTAARIEARLCNKELTVDMRRFSLSDLFIYYWIMDGVSSASALWPSVGVSTAGKSSGHNGLSFLLTNWTTCVFGLNDLNRDGNGRLLTDLSLWEKKGWDSGFCRVGRAACGAGRSSFTDRQKLETISVTFQCLLKASC